MFPPVIGGAWSGCTPPSDHTPGTYGKPLAKQIRKCEKKWAAGCLRVACGEVAPAEASMAGISLVGIAGNIHNSQLLYFLFSFLLSPPRRCLPALRLRTRGATRITTVPPIAPLPCPYR